MSHLLLLLLLLLLSTHQLTMGHTTDDMSWVIVIAIKWVPVTTLPEY